MTHVNAKLGFAHVHLTLNQDNQIKELKLIASSLLNPPMSFSPKVMGH
jgi:hypothetical protein